MNYSHQIQREILHSDYEIPWLTTAEDSLVWYSEIPIEHDYQYTSRNKTMEVSGNFHFDGEDTPAVQNWSIIIPRMRYSQSTTAPD